MEGKIHTVKMKLPIQSAPVDRGLSKGSYAPAGVIQSRLLRLPDRMPRALRLGTLLGPMRLS